MSNLAAKEYDGNTPKMEIVTDILEDVLRMVGPDTASEVIQAMCDLVNSGDEMTQTEYFARRRYIRTVNKLADGMAMAGVPINK